MADPWAEFQDAPRSSRRRGGMIGASKADPWAEFNDAPTGAVDGDTVSLRSGGNARLFGADAFEADQTGRQGGQVVPLGAQSRATLQENIAPDSRMTTRGEQSYGRPVVAIETGGDDVARRSISEGMALPVPKYLAADPARQSEYIGAQREAIAAERGAYAGQYQVPSEFRRMGGDAPWQGKVPMAADEYREYAALLRDPKTTPEALEAWAARRGRRITNAGNLLAFMRDNPNATIGGEWQQADVTGEPVLRDGPGVVVRSLGAFNEGLADLLGAPVDLVNAGLGAIGVPVSDRPFLGSESIREGMRSVGIGQFDDSYSPRTDAERYAQAFARGTGQAALPIGGQLAAGGRLALRAPSLLTQGSAVRSATRGALVDAARRPGVLIAGEAGAGAGAGLSGQVADDLAPGNPYAMLAAQVAGGLGGGLGAGMGAARLTSGRAAPLLAPERGPVPPRPPRAANDPLPVAQDGDPEDVIAALDNVPGRNADAVQERLQNEQQREIDRAFPENAPGARRSSIPPELRRAIDAEQAYYGRPGEKAADVAARRTPEEDARLWRELQTAREAWEAVQRGERPPLDLTPDMAMANEAPVPSITGRIVDRLDVSRTEPAPTFRGLAEPSLSRRPRPLMEPASPEELARIARGIAPGDVTAIPSNAVEGPEELARIGDGMRPRLAAPNERDALPPFQVGGRTRRDPLDLLSFLRASGGIREQGGELRAMGVDNRPRDLDFARSEGFLGALVREDGRSLDEAARLAWEAGYFPDSPERPTVAEFLDAVRATHMGGSGRVFRPDDYGAIDDFYAAQNARFRIEQAEQSGAPLYEDRGQPIGPDDLRAMEPPATAYEDLPSVGGKIANINLGNVETVGDIRRLLQATETRFGGFDAARRGKITQAETTALASELGMTPDDLMKRRRGQALNAEQALAARQLLAKSSDELLRMAKKVQTGGADADMIEFQRAMIRHAAIYEQVTAATAEAGRALQAFRIPAEAKAIQGRIHKAALGSGSGTRDNLEDVAAAIVDLQEAGVGPGKVTRFAVDAQKPKFRDKLVELWYNSLLSGPQTHVVNITSNFITAGLQIPEQLTASALGAFRRRSFDRVLASEIGPRVIGFYQGARDGLRRAVRTMQTGEVIDPLTKVEAQTQRAISGLKGEVIRTPTRALSAEDEFFKAIASRMELNALAVRQARSEGLRGEALRNRIAALVENPTDDMVAKSFDYARYLTFQRPLGPGGNALLALTNAHPALKLFLPFIRTPTNLLKFALERSPAAPILKEVRDDLAAGGAKRDLAAARIMLGTGLAFTVASLAAEGKVTGGGPMDDNARRLLQADGWQPYSVKVGDEWVSYQRLDPLSTTVGIAADFIEKQEAMTDSQRENAAVLLVASVMQNLSDKTWLSGISSIVEALDDPQRSLGSVAGRTVGSMAVPAIVAQTARANDPIIREARTLLDNVKSRVPGLSSDLPARRDVFGNARRRENIGPDLLSPFPASRAKNDPIIRELQALGSRLSPPARNLRNVQTGKRERLTPREYSEYAALAGNLMRQGLEDLVTAPDYPTLTLDEKRYEVDAVKRDARRMAREALFPGRFSEDSEPAIPAPSGYSTSASMLPRMQLGSQTNALAAFAPAPPPPQNALARVGPSTQAVPALNGAPAGILDPWAEFADAPRR